MLTFHSLSLKMPLRLVNLPTLPLLVLSLLKAALVVVSLLLVPLLPVLVDQQLLLLLVAVEAALLPVAPLQVPLQLRPRLLTLVHPHRLLLQKVPLVKLIPVLLLPSWVVWLLFTSFSNYPLFISFYIQQHNVIPFPSHLHTSEGVAYCT